MSSPHPEVPLPTCMSCGRGLAPEQIKMLGGFLTATLDPHRGVPDDVDCCSACWRRIPPQERIRITIMVRDRQMGGVLNVLAELVHNGILNMAQTSDDPDRPGPRRGG